MHKMELRLDADVSVVVHVEKCLQGSGVRVSHFVQHATAGPTSVTVTCTCGSGASARSVTKECPSNQGNTCDCSDPQKPKITCGQ